MTDTPYSLPRQKRRLLFSALAVGGLGLAVCFLGAGREPQQFFRSYLQAYIFYCGIALGCLGVLMMSHLTGGAWGLVGRRVFESAARTLPLLLLLFAPIALGIRWLYPWARPEDLAASGLLRHKHLYLNVPFFFVRSGVFFALWIVLAWLLGRFSRQQKSGNALELGRRMRTISGPGLLLYGLTASFAYMDWVMTLRPEWSSTIFGLLIVAGQGLSAYAFVILVLFVLSRRPKLSHMVSPKVLHDLGKLMQALILLWAYMAFSQFLIIWSGNLPREITWYMPRTQTSWQWLGVLLIVGHFALPFFLLLFRELKRRWLPLAGLAGFVLVMRLCDEFWLIAPDFDTAGLRIHWMDLVTVFGLGGLWLAYFLWLLRRSPLLPLGCPGLGDALVQESSEKGVEHEPQQIRTY